MNFIQLQAVTTVIKTGSVSVAAERLRLSQPAVTKQIRSLEDELKVKLFDRVGRGIVPTPTARAMMPRMERVLHEMEQIRNELTETRSGSSGAVHIGSGPVFARTVMPDVVSACREEHPNMRIFMTEAAVTDQVPRLRQGELRICLGPDYLEHADLAFEPLLSDELVLIAPKNHRLARSRGPIAIGQIRDEPIIMHLYARLVERSLRRVGRSPRPLLDDNRVNASTTNTETITALVAKGLGISLVPRYIAHLLRHPKVAIRKIQPKLPIQFGYYHLRSATLAPVESAFIEVLRSVLQQKQSSLLP